jgi:hypothetical protein
MYRFVDRDMFMRFRGGGVGHQATRGWDEFLQREGHGRDNSGDDSLDLEEDVEGENSELDDDLEVHEEEGEQDSSSGEDDEDIVIPDNGEELDDDVLAEEGYGAL